MCSACSSGGSCDEAAATGAHFREAAAYASAPLVAAHCISESRSRFASWRFLDARESGARAATLESRVGRDQIRRPRRAAVAMGGYLARREAYASDQRQAA